MDNRRLLVEYIPFNVSPSLIKESQEKNNGKIIVRGLLQSSDTLNQNGREYPDAILRRESEKFMDKVSNRRALGELDHPDSPVVSLANSSHLIKDIKWEGKNLFGELEILNTPSGKILESLLQSGVKLGISSRGLGSTRRDESRNAEIVEDDFQLITFDFVSDPSTPGAFMLREGKETMSLKEIANKEAEKGNREIYKSINNTIRDILEVYSNNQNKETIRN